MELTADAPHSLAALGLTKPLFRVQTTWIWCGIIFAVVKNKE